MLSEQTFDTGELTIHYVEAPADGPPLILIHGLTLTWENFKNLIPHLTPDWHVYACDLRGHGRSGHMAGRYQMADYIADIVAFLRGHVAEPATIVGHSAGGLIALGVAAAAPELVRALVLLDPAFIVRNTRLMDIAQYEWFGWAYETISSPRSNAEMIERCRARAPEGSEAELQGLADYLFRLDPDALRVWMEDREWEGYNLEDVMRQVQVPTLILCGEPQLDSTVSIEDAELAQSALPQGVLVRIPDAGHMVYDEQTDVVVQYMRTFLRAI